MPRRLNGRSRPPSIHFSESDGVRNLHVGGTAIQSAMRIDQPDELALAYTRAMVATLLFVAKPRDILLVGLGGGSLAKYLHRRLPRTRLVAVEVDARVVEAAHAFFGLPIGRPRLKVLVADGAAHVEHNPGSTDIILLDAFVNHRQAPSVRTQAFYAHAAAALRPGGVLAINFMLDDPGLRVYLRRLANAFGSEPWCLRAKGEDNVIAFARREPLADTSVAALAARAAELERLHGMEFRSFASRLRPARRITSRGVPLYVPVRTRPARVASAAAGARR